MVDTRRGGRPIDSLRRREFGIIAVPYVDRQKAPDCTKSQTRRQPQSRFDLYTRVFEAEDAASIPVGIRPWPVILNVGIVKMVTAQVEKHVVIRQVRKTRGEVDEIGFAGRRPGSRPKMKAAIP